MNAISSYTVFENKLEENEPANSTCISADKITSCNLSTVETGHNLETLNIVTENFEDYGVENNKDVP